MDLIKQFSANIQEFNLFQQGDHLLLAVSGGVDSVVLCELCHHSNLTFSIAHVNFQLRGKESDGDEEFVRALADKYRVPIHVKLFETEKYAASEKVSIQVAARDLRYAWFNELLVTGYQWLLTAHHADDNLETVMMNFFRGTGISGLRGMLPKTNRIVRPLLPFSKQQIVAFAREHQLDWREDSSNDSDKYSRNYFRHAIIPQVKNIYPETENNLLENIQRFREIEELYVQAVTMHKNKLLEVRGDEIHIPVLKLKKSEPLRTIVHEIIKPYHFTAHQVDEVIQLIDAEHGKLVRSSSHRIIKNRNWLIIAENRSDKEDFIIIERDQAAGGPLTINYLKENNNNISTDKFTAHLNVKHVEFPLIFRKWKSGDYFYPLGMAKKKKISRFLIDQKLSPTQKERVMVIESGKKIVWVAGMRIDDRFKVTPQTKEIIELNYRPSSY